MSEQVRMSEVSLGDLITEVGTPEGPWYRVERMTPKSMFVSYQGADALEDEPQMRFGRSERALVLRRAS